jgi:hypothetical protein
MFIRNHKMLKSRNFKVRHFSLFLGQKYRWEQPWSAAVQVWKPKAAGGGCDEWEIPKMNSF